MRKTAIIAGFSGLATQCAPAQTARGRAGQGREKNRQKNGGARQNKDIPVSSLSSMFLQESGDGAGTTVERKFVCSPALSPRPRENCRKKAQRAQKMKKARSWRWWAGGKSLVGVGGPEWPDEDNKRGLVVVFPGHVELSGKAQPVSSVPHAGQRRVDCTQFEIPGKATPDAQLEYRKYRNAGEDVILK